jgi:CRP-like cAMP-binding protein
LKQRSFPPFSNILDEDPGSQEMYIVRSGTLDVWSDPENPGELPRQPKKAATIKPGEMVGEFTMLDQGLRTADLITGPEGATILALDRDRLLALAEDDSELGSQLLWNIATVMSQRARFIIWQLQRARQRAKAEQRLWEQERERQAILPGRG